MQNRYNYFFVLSFLIFIGCSTVTKIPKERIVSLSSNFGNITIKLYNETPQHRDNFIKLASEGYYNELLFHRVINEFMIQGGDPDSKIARAGQSLGNGGPGYTIPAEFNPNLFHKKGALAAARTGDNINPEKKSSGSQFYIVQGKTFTDEELNSLEQNINQSRKNSLMNKLFLEEKQKAMSQNENFDYSKVIEKVKTLAEEEFKNSTPFSFTEEQRTAYKTIGGTPHLDGSYTVFGEIIEGIEIIDKIASVKTDSRNRPLKDIKMTITILK